MGQSYADPAGALTIRLDAIDATSATVTTTSSAAGAAAGGAAGLAGAGGPPGGGCACTSAAPADLTPSDAVFGLGVGGLVSIVLGLSSRSRRRRHRG